MIIHAEKAPIGRFVIVVFYAGMAVLFGIFLLTPPQPKSAAFTLLGVMILLSMVMRAFKNMAFVLTDKGVVARMWPFTIKVHYDDIKSVHVIRDIPWYVGFGLRIWGRRLAFVTRKGPAVQIDKRKGFFSSLVMTTQNPEEFRDLINEQRKTKG